MKKIINFIKYNNSFVIILGLIFASVSGAMASETARDAVIGKTIITREGIDNNQIINADLSNLNLNFKIMSITEDEKGYAVKYYYNTIYIKNNIWQPLAKEEEMYVSKSALSDKDLGLYISEELRQKADREIAYLKDVQSIEKKKGLKIQTESVQYTGLKGLVFESGKREISGYNPVKEEKNKEEMTGNYNPASVVSSGGKNDGQPETILQTQVVKESVDKNVIREIVKEILDNKAESEKSSAMSSSSQISTSTSSSSFSSSLSAGGYSAGPSASSSSLSSSESSSQASSEPISSSSSSSSAEISSSASSSAESSISSSQSLSSAESSSAQSSSSESSLASSAESVSESNQSASSSSDSSPI